MSAADLVVGMPIYNGERFLEEALASVTAQTYRNFSLVISDNASTDATAEICKRWVSKDPRISYSRRPNTLRPSEHFLFLLRGATLPFFSWAACDDLWDPEFLELTVGALKRQPSAVVAFGTYAFIDETGTLFGGTRRPSYGGGSTAVRIARLAHQWDDGIFYGVYRRSALDGLQIPTWWGMNRDIPLNVAYPPLCYVLAKGDHCVVGDRPLWFSRQHTTKSYRGTVYDEGVVREHLAFALRKANMASECVKQVYRASGSIRTAAEAAPSVTTRAAFDVARQSTLLAYNLLRGALR